MKKGSNQTGLNKIVSNQITQASMMSVITFVKLMCFFMCFTGPSKKKLVNDGKFYTKNLEKVNCFCILWTSMYSSYA